MARPRSFDRDVALERALHAFWTEGYENTSISDLTGAMGVSPPSLYAAFGDKRRLFDEAAARYAERLEGGLARALAAPTARAAVERVLRDAAAQHTATDHPPGCLAMSEPRLAACRADVRTAIVARLRAAGDFRGDPEAAAELVEVILTGMSARARDGATRAQLDAVIDAALAGWD